MSATNAAPQTDLSSVLQGSKFFSNEQGSTQYRQGQNTNKLQQRKEAKTLSVMTGKRATQQDKKDVRPLLLMYAEAIEKTQ